MVVLNNDTVYDSTFTNADMFNRFRLNFEKRKLEPAYAVYGGPYIKWMYDSVVDNYLLVHLLQYLHDEKCPRVTLAVFEPYGKSTRLPIGLSIGYPACIDKYNWMNRGVSVTDDRTICEGYTIYKYNLEGVYG